ncbi:putative UDP-glycosyltransferase 88B1 [Iris pallida]|uniref:UDP-glycosyltransferase 88B1 n=1 Tax=Iris pallida TaxID=29817 RepID=A0AAX6GP78_IRIPA|nr:putative UDP-glycosyltransferase 88B1 [Iris pallida]
MKTPVGHCQQKRTSLSSSSPKQLKKIIVKKNNVRQADNGGPLPITGHGPPGLHVRAGQATRQPRPLRHRDHRRAALQHRLHRRVHRSLLRFQPFRFLPRAPPPRLPSPQPFPPPRGPCHRPPPPLQPRATALPPRIPSFRARPRLLLRVRSRRLRRAPHPRLLLLHLRRRGLLGLPQLPGPPLPHHRQLPGDGQLPAPLPRHPSAPRRPHAGPDARPRRPGLRGLPLLLQTVEGSGGLHHQHVRGPRAEGRRGHFGRGPPSKLLYRPAHPVRRPGEQQRRVRVLGLARRAAEEVGGLPLLREHRAVLFGAAEGDGGRAGEERAEVPVGGPEPAERRLGQAVRGPARARPGAHTSRRVSGEDQGEGACGEVVGAAGCGAGARVGRGVRDALRVELDAGGDRQWRSDGGVADVRGAVDEQGVPCGRDEAGGADGGVRQGHRERGGGGEEGEVADGVGGGSGAESPDGACEGEGRCVAGGRRDVESGAAGAGGEDETWNLSREKKVGRKWTVLSLWYEVTKVDAHFSFPNHARKKGSFSKFELSGWNLDEHQLVMVLKIL